MENLIHAEISVSNRDYNLVMKPCMRGHYHVISDTHAFGMRNLTVRCDKYFAAYCLDHAEDGVFFYATE